MNKTQTPPQIKSLCWLFGVIGLISLSKFLDTEKYEITLGTILVGLQGIAWILYGVLRNKTGNGSVFALLASISSLAVLFNVLIYSFSEGFIFESPNASEYRRGWLVVLLPILSIIACSLGSFLSFSDFRRKK